MGHFEECVTAKAPFLTKYCLTMMTANVPTPKVHTDDISLDHDPYEHVLERLYVSVFFTPAWAKENESLEVRKKIM